MDKTRKIILSALVAVGIITAGGILLNPSDPEFLTVQEWRVLVSIYNEEAEGGIELGHIKRRADILNRLDEKVLEKTKSRNKDYKNLTKGLIYKRNPDLK